MFRMNGSKCAEVYNSIHLAFFEQLAANIMLYFSRRILRDADT